MRTVFVENNDSFSFNVIDTLPIARADLQIVSSQSPQVRDVVGLADLVVIGPGPMDPLRAGLLPIVDVCVLLNIPLLGICLGHQAIGLTFGSSLEKQVPVHGHTALAHFEKSRLFPGIEGLETVMRYHSLTLKNVKSPLSVIASLPDGTVMAVEHESLPIAGLQFHPDSFGTPNGRKIVKSFFENAPAVPQVKR